MTEETLQERYIRELLDPRSALSPREVAAREEIISLRAQLQPQKAAKVAKAKQEVEK